MKHDDRPRPRRRHIPIEARREAARRQGGVCPCGCGTACWADPKETIPLVEWDHEPALRLRDVNAAGTDYVPAQLDPAYLVGRCPVSHLAKTSGTGATTAGTDAGKIKKERRRRKALSADDDGKKSTAKYNRKYNWSKGRKLCSGNGFKNQKGKRQWQKRVSQKITSGPSSTG